MTDINQDKKIKVSIVIPAYNCMEYIDQCMDSILNQTFSSFEIIIVENGSTDGTDQRCDELKKQDDRIRVIHITQNAGVSEARNRGIEEADGDYIVFVDSDDWIAENELEILVQNIETSAADVVFCDYFKVQGDRTEKCPKILEYGIYENDKIDIVLRNMFAGGAYFSSIWRGIYKKEVINRGNIRFEKLKFAEDLLFNIEYLLNSKKVYLIEEALYYYFVNEQSSLNRLKDDIGEIIKFPIELCKKIRQYEVIEEYQKELEIEIIIALQRIFNVSLRYNDFKKGVEEFYQNGESIFKVVNFQERTTRLFQMRKWIGLYITMIIGKIKIKLRKK